MPWQQQVPGIFGAQDLIFGGHPQERQRARQLLLDASGASASLKELLDEAEKYLKSKAAQPQHIADQLDRMKQLEHWLS